MFIASLASSLLSLSPIIGKKNTNDHIMGIFLVLLRDEDPEVRLNTFKKLDDFTKVYICIYIYIYIYTYR